MITSQEIMKALFPPNGEMIPIGMVKNFTNIEQAVNNLVATLNGEQIKPTKTEARTPEWYAARNQRLQRIMKDNPGMPNRIIADLAGVSLGVVKSWRVKCVKDEAVQEAAALQQEGYAALSGQAVQIAPIPVTIQPPPKEFVLSCREAAKEGQDATERRIDQAIQDVGKVGPTLTPKRSRDLTPSEAGKVKGPRIPHGEDEFIFSERSDGKKFPEIRAALAERGISCTDTDVASRYYQVKADRVKAAKFEISQPEMQTAPPVQPEPQNDPSQPGVEGAQKEARANPRGTPEADKQESKFISRHALSEKIWEMYKAGKTPDQISDELCQEGYYYGKDRVRRMLIQQGAEL
jgi:hypothetical protein